MQKNYFRSPSHTHERSVCPFIAKAKIISQDKYAIISRKIQIKEKYKSLLAQKVITVTIFQVQGYYMKLNMGYTKEKAYFTVTT